MEIKADFHLSGTIKHLEITDVSKEDIKNIIEICSLNLPIMQKLIKLLK